MRRVVVNLPDELVDILDKAASEHGAARGEIIRRALSEAFTDLPEARSEVEEYTVDIYESTPLWTSLVREKAMLVSGGASDILAQARATVEKEGWLVHRNGAGFDQGSPKRIRVSVEPRRSIRVTDPLTQKTTLVLASITREQLAAYVERMEPRAMREVADRYGEYSPTEFLQAYCVRVGPVASGQLLREGV